jgi:opacity protein-like surface antigen
LLGLEGDWTRIGASSHQHDSFSHLHSNWDWAATLRVRAGLALDRSLIYVTGGIVTAQFDVGGFVDGSTYGTNHSFKSRTTKDGLAFGAGYEHGFANHLSAKAEYLHLGLPHYSLRDLYDPHNTLHYGAKNDADLFRFGLNYRF